MRRGRRAGAGPEAVSAGLAAGLFFAFAPLPVQVAVAADMGLSETEAARWIFVVWATGAVASAVMSVAYRQPIAITWSILGLLYLGSVAGDHSFEELVGANLVAGIAILALALAGVGERVMRLVPLPIVLGMFAGSVLEFVTGAVTATAADGLVGGAAIGGYLAARAAGSRWVPPVAVAVACGVAAVAAGGGIAPVDLGWSAPPLAPPGIAFSPDALLTVSPPLVVMALALGNIQGLGYLGAQGYRVPVNAVSIAVGAGSIANALLGGHQASVGRGTTAIVAGPDAGPVAGRHWASVIASVLALGIALAAGLVVAVVGALPPSFVAVVTGLAVLSTFQDSLARALGGAMRTGAMTAFLVAATPVSAAGLGSSTWALIAGVAVSLAVDRQATTASRPSSAFIPSSRAVRSALARWASAAAAPRSPAPSRSALASSNEAHADSGR